MSTCKDCLHYEVCEALENGNGVKKIHPIQCGCFKPKADYAPVKHSKWESVGNDEYRCLICKHAPIVDINDNWNLSNYCPRCGANMKGGAE